MTTASDNLLRNLSARPVPLVLVTDDDADTRSLFTTMIELRGYTVVEAVDGVEAVRLYESARPDLILMDGNLPGLDGLTATRRIRQLEHSGRVPIVFVSGRAEPGFLAQAREAGCDDFLIKPVRLKEFGVILEKYLGRGAQALAV